jgi:hypothetical protein
MRDFLIAAVPAIALLLAIAVIGFSFRPDRRQVW